ncbi:MAG: FAD:protein FMN transferase [Solirubrobacterales bacterium]|nr:FAD:protein FMN transferase [Solirubrobacterales bacterium]
MIVAGGAEARGTARMARTRLLEWHRQFSRFEADSELSRLNRDPRPTVPVTPLMRRILEAGVAAARRTGGLVDPTLVAEVEAAGYAAHLERPGAALAELLARAPARTPAGAHPAAGWQAVDVDRRAGTVSRPPGLRFDSGGIAKGVFADELATLLSDHDAFVVDCGGDLRLGGRARVAREVHVASPFGDAVAQTFRLSGGGIATSGIGKRSWLTPDGRPAHHLIDPRAGAPAFTGIVQATAVAPTATEAEVLSKAAILSGPGRAERVLIGGGVIVFDDGSISVIDP